MPRKTIRNELTTPELIAQINPDNLQLLNDFEDYLRSVQRSEGTILGYDDDIKIFFVWNLQNNKNKFFADLTKRNVVSYQNYLLNILGLSPARVRRLKAALSSMSNFIENVLDDEDEFKGFRNIINKVENPVAKPVREKTVWDQEEIDSLLDVLVKEQKYEQACFLALAVFGGRRKAELCRFRVSDFDDKHLICNGSLYKSDPILTKGRGGGKMLHCYTLAKKFKPYLDLWLSYRKENGMESTWLFPSKNDPTQHISIVRANSFSDTYSKLSGRDAYLHSLRHLFVTNLSKENIPDGVIQSIVGWTSGDMVRIYKDIDVDEEIGMYFNDGEIVAPEKKNLSQL